MKKKIFITGGAGYVGSFLSDYLVDKGYDVTVYDLCIYGENVFKYCDKNGNISDDSNPNGSLANIAGICNKNKNVFGMMPHPERAADPLLSNVDGVNLFKSILNYIK